MLSGGEAALLASHVIDDLVLPINCIDQQGRLVSSVTAHSKALCRQNSILPFLFVMGGSAATVSARLLALLAPLMQPPALRYAGRRINISKWVGRNRITPALKLCSTPFCLPSKNRKRYLVEQQLLKNDERQEGPRSVMRDV